MMTSISKRYYQILLSQGVCSAIGVAAIFQAGIYIYHMPPVRLSFCLISYSGQLHPQLVQQEARCGIRYSILWLKYWGSHLPYHDQQAN